jgi:PTS system mannose-specific IIC component
MQVVLTSVWGGLLALERRAFLQAMVSRPLVAGTITGALLHDVEGGLFVGLVFELLHLGGASLGGAHADHDTLPAVAGASMAASAALGSGEPSTPAHWAIAILFCAPFGRAGLLLENRLDGRARKYFGRAKDAAESGHLKRAARQNLRAMWPQFIFYGLICGAAALAGPSVYALGKLLPPPFLRGLGWAYPAMAVAAAAVAVQGSHAPSRLRIALVAAVTTAAVMVGVSGWRP